MALFLLLTLVGCEDVFPGLVPCRGFEPALGGAWTLRGEGHRTGCEDPRLDGSFTIRTPAPLHVQQSFSDALTLRTPVPGITFSGAVSSFCFVEFSIVEETPDGPIEYEFHGDPDDDPEIEDGDFTGTGPGTCTMTGRFHVSIAP